jgi:peptide/nickel transport system substrate-binding protein
MTDYARITALAVAIGAALAGTSAWSRDLTIGLSAEASSMDPHFQQLLPNNAVRLHIFESLVAADANQQLRPSLATKWEAINDTTWRLTLREKVKFNNGDAFTARDMIYSVCRIPLIQESPSPFTIYTKVVAAMRAENDHTLIVETKTPDPIFPVEMANIAILSASANGVTGPVAFRPDGCEGIGMPPRSRTFSDPANAVGTGPYKLSSHTPGDRIVLERNESYWGDRPEWDKVIMRPITSDASRVAALLAGDVDMIENPPAQDLDRIRQAGFKVVLAPSSRLIYLHMDQEGEAPGLTASGGRNPLLDSRVRAAISRGIDRKAIVARIMGGIAQAAGELLPPPMFGTLGREPEAYDPDGARKLMAEAGYADGFEIILGAPNDRYVNDERIAQTIAQMLARIGIKVKVDATTASQFFTRRNKQEYPFYLSGWTSPTGEPSSPLTTLAATYDKVTGRGASNAGRYSNARMDALLNEATHTLDDVKRANLLRQAQTIVLADYGILPLHFEAAVWAFKQDLDYKPRADQYTLAFEVRSAD